MADSWMSPDDLGMLSRFFSGADDSTGWGAATGGGGGGGGSQDSGMPYQGGEVQQPGGAGGGGGLYNLNALADPNARAGNLFLGGFVPTINYAMANQGATAQKGPANPYAGYTPGMSALDQSLSSSYGSQAPYAAQQQQRTRPARDADPMQDGLKSYLYGG